MRRALLFSICATGCWHSVSVIVPASDVKERRYVTALVTPGKVEPFSRREAYVENGFLVSRGRLEKVDPTDLVVIHARDGDAFGKVRVRHTWTSDALSVVGVLVGVGGMATSITVAGLAMRDVKDGPFAGVAGGAYLGLGFLAVIASVGLGAVIFAVGQNTPLHIDGVRF